MINRLLSELEASVDNAYNKKHSSLRRPIILCATYGIAPEVQNQTDNCTIMSSFYSAMHLVREPGGV